MPQARPISAAAARRFLVLRHFLAPPRSLAAVPESVLTVIDRLGSFQFDPLVIAGRNHDVILHARIEGYRPEWTDGLLYERGLLFEAWNKGLSILPTLELPWYRVTWERDRAAHERAGTFRTNADVVRQLLDRIREHGPVSSLDFERGADIDWYWRPTNQVRAMLEALWEVGTLGIARRKGNIRYYDLAERLFPAELLEERVDEREQLRHKLLSRYRAHGLLGTGGQSELWIGINERLDDGTRRQAPLRAELLSELLDRERLVPVSVEGVRGVRFVLNDELPLLDQAEAELDPEEEAGSGSGNGAIAASPRPGGSDPGVAFLAPLDPFVWDRRFLKELYRFDYVWEVYVPEAKRRWGYYVLPILFADRLVGRIEPRFDRKANTLWIVGLFWEQDFRPRAVDGFVPAMRQALEAYRLFGRVGGIEWAQGLETWGRLLTPRPARGSSSGTTAAVRVGRARGATAAPGRR